MDAAPEDFTMRLPRYSVLTLLVTIAIISAVFGAWSFQRLSRQHSAVAVMHRKAERQVAEQRDILAKGVGRQAGSQLPRQDERQVRPGCRVPLAFRCARSAQPRIGSDVSDEFARQYEHETLVATHRRACEDVETRSRSSRGETPRSIEFGGR
jgi:hypothetical protein